jgi:GT2 family glycosyltransferase
MADEWQRGSSGAGEVGDSKTVIPVVILNWNGEEDTLECLRSIRKSIPAGFLPVLIDNGSRAESLERLKRECGLLFSKILFLQENEWAALQGSPLAELLEDLKDDSLVLIENGENLGFAKGNNVGIRFAEWLGAEWVMLLNNDTVVSPDTFQELRRFLRSHPSFAAITAQIRDFGSNGRIQNCGGDLTYFGSRKYKFANRDAALLPQADFSVITFITGCVLLFQYKVTGVLTEDFFFGEEDYEFSLRMKSLGLEMACVHQAVVYHKGGASIAKSSRPLGAILVQYVSRLINTRNHYSRMRWQVTRILAYLYLPVLLTRNGIDPRRSVGAIRRVQSYLKRYSRVSRAQFSAIISLQ